MKYSVLKFFIIVGIIGTIASFVGMNEMESRAGIARAAGSIYNNNYYSNDRENLYYDEIKEFQFYKNLCITGIIASILLSATCTVAHVAGKNSDKKKTSKPSQFNTIVDKLKELDTLKNSNLITEQEYNEKRNNILANY